MSYKRFTPDEVFHNRLTDPEAIAAFLRGDIRRPLEIIHTNCGFMDTFLEQIHRHGKVDSTVIAAAMGVSRHALSITVATLTDLPPHEWISKYFQLSARILLKKTKLPIKEIAQRLGFSSTNTFTQFFIRVEKMPPGDWRYSK